MVPPHVNEILLLCVRMCDIVKGDSMVVIELVGVVLVWTIVRLVTWLTEDNSTGAGKQLADKLVKRLEDEI